MLVLGAVCSFLEPFFRHLSPKIDKVSEELTLRYPHEGPCVVQSRESVGDGGVPTHQCYTIPNVDSTVKCGHSFLSPVSFFRSSFSSVPVASTQGPSNPQSKVIFGRFRQLFEMNAHKMAPSTGQWLQVRVWDTPTKGLLWFQALSIAAYVDATKLS